MRSNNTVMRRHFIDGRYGQIHLRTAQPADMAEQPECAIVCLHMMPKSGRGYTELMPELAQNHLVIAPDYPGYGESGPFPADKSPSMQDYTDSVHEVIEHFGLQQVFLIGYHTGSMVAVDLADQYPDLVTKVINISAPIFTEQEVTDFLTYFSPIPLDEAGTRYRTMWERIMQFRGPGMTLEMAATSIAENLRGGERYEDGHYAAFNFTQRYTEKMSRIKQPLLVMNVGDDLFEQSKRADQYINNGERVDFPDWGHGFIDLWPDQAAKVMLDFLTAKGNR